MIRNILAALGAGFVGGLVNAVAVLSISATYMPIEFDKNFFYRQAVWGGAWGMLYSVPLFRTPKVRSQWMIRGAIVGALASLATFFIFAALPLTPFNVVRAFSVNMIVWGGVSSYLYYRCSFSPWHCR